MKLKKAKNKPRNMARTGLRELKFVRTLHISYE